MVDPGDAAVGGVNELRVHGDPHVRMRDRGSGKHQTKNRNEGGADHVGRDNSTECGAKVAAAMTVTKQRYKIHNPAAPPSARGS